MTSAGYRVKSRVKNYLGSLKVPILALTPISVILGAGAAFRSSGQIDKNSMLLLMFGAIAGHLSVIDFHDFFDYQAGHKMDAREIPYGGLVGNPAGTESAARETLVLALFFLSVSAGICAYFTLTKGLPVLLLWLAGLFLLVTYPFLNKRIPLLSVFIPGAGLGVILVMLSCTAMGGGITRTSFIISLIPFFLVNAFFLVSHLLHDNVSGWNNLQIKNGRLLSGCLYALCIFCAYGSLILGRGLNAIPSDSLLALVTSYVAIPAAYGAVKYSRDVDDLISFPGFNLIICMITPVLVAAGLFFG